MEPVARTPTFPGRAHRLMAVAVAAGCWLAAPAGAEAQQAPVLDVSGLTQQVTAATPAPVAPAVESAAAAAAPLAGPARDAVRQAAGTVARVTAPSGPVARVATSAASAAGSVAERVGTVAAPVAGVADQVSGRAQPAVDETLQGVTRSAPRDNGTPGAAAGQGSPRVERLAGPAGSETSRASRLRLRGTDAAERSKPALPGSPAERVASVFTPLIPGPAKDLPGTPAGGGETAAPSGVLEPPSDTQPVSGAAGGSSAAGASVTFSLGGLALLLVTLCLAGPALRRRLPRRPVMGWPAAFVPLLERPG